LRGATLQLNYNNTKVPIVGNVWRHHAIPLSPSPNWRRSSDGEIATQTDFLNVLSNLTRVAIRGEFENGGETNYLDNVVFDTCSPSGAIFPTSNNPGVGAQVNLSASVAGDGPFEFHWTRNGSEIDPATNPSALTALLNIANVRPYDSGVYECIVVNACGSVTTNSSKVSVCGGDLNLDLAVDDADFSLFVQAYDALECTAPSMPVNCPADLNTDGVVNDSDFELFVVAYNVLLCP